MLMSGLENKILKVVDEYKIYVDNNELININDNSFVSLLKIKLIGETVENVVFEHKTYNAIIEFSSYC